MSASYLVKSTHSPDRNLSRLPVSSSFDAHTSAFESTALVPAYTNHYPGLEAPPPRLHQPMLIASISAGFEKGDFLVREEKGSNIYFDFFEEAFNFICQKGYSRMNCEEEEDYIDMIKRAHKSVPGGCRFNTGRLLVVLKKNLIPVKVSSDEDEEPSGTIMEERSLGYNAKESALSSKRHPGRAKTKLVRSRNTLPTDSDSSTDSPSHVSSSAYSSASTSYADSWE